MNAKNSTWLILFLVCCSLLTAADTAGPRKKRADPTKQPPAAAAATAPVAPVPLATPVPTPPPEVQPAARIVHYGEKDIIQLKTKILNSTMIVLPKNEKILEFVTGDKEYWIINGSENFCYVKPAKTATQTNLNLITASGNIYSFVLTEVSEQPDSVPDLKVFIEPKEQSLIGAANQAPRFVPAHDLDDLQRRLEASREEVRKQKRITEESVENAVHKFLTGLRFTYRFQPDKTFSVRAIFHDEKFTYIAAHPSETPTLFEIRDGQPNLITFEFQNGLYVVQKILDKGYLAIGKHKLEFASEE
jgi:type IV secretion system protein VirB9